MTLCKASDTPARPGVFSEIPSDVESALAEWVRRRPPAGLFSHQRAAIDAIFRGENVVVATRTSSGKSLIYGTPVLQMLSKDASGTALFLFPQKALANDQLLRLRETAAELPGMADLLRTSPDLIARYDGSTPDDAKKGIRERGRVLLTNPDMLHYSVLSWHDRHWQRFLSGLRYVVVDECHDYRGIFGTNVAYILRRLRAMCARYGSDPRFIATSATVNEPARHLATLTGLDFTVVGERDDGSRQGRRKIWLVQSSERYFAAGRKLAEALSAAGLTTLVFCLSRKSAEEMVRDARAKGAADSVRVYRAGLRADERVEIENGLRAGTVKTVFSTSALKTLAE